jgi:pyruvate/2-oxoglutarate dehydrogenase complex dihydrolipoamide acyltransferase (E2) component
VKVREGLRETYARAGVKLTYLAFIVKAVVKALQEVPVVNASLDEQAGEIVLHDRYHVGIAVATPNGLLVPVVRDADRKSLADVAREIEKPAIVGVLGEKRQHSGCPLPRPPGYSNGPTGHREVEPPPPQAA